MWTSRNFQRPKVQLFLNSDNNSANDIKHTSYQRYDRVASDTTTQVQGNLSKNEHMVVTGFL